MRRDQQMAHDRHTSQIVKAELKRSPLLIGIVVVMIVAYFFIVADIQNLRHQIVQLEQRYMNNITIIQYRFDQEFKGLKDYFVKIKLQLKDGRQQKQHLLQEINNMKEVNKNANQELKKLIQKYKQLSTIKGDVIRLNNIQSQINKLNESSSKYQGMVNMLFDNQLSKQIKEYNFMLKNSHHFLWTIYLSLNAHYRILLEKPLRIIKKTNERSYIFPDNLQVQVQNPQNYPILPLPQGRSFFQIIIQKTNSNEIAIGVFTQEPKIFYYFLTKDKNIYKGQTPALSSPIKSSDSEITIKEKDKLTLFYDGQLKLIVWYLNNKYISHTTLPKDYLGKIIAFIRVQHEGDIITIQ